MGYSLTFGSSNRKTGPIPVSMSSAASCPGSCPLKRSGCYAESGHMAMHWQRLNGGGLDWRAFLARVASIPRGWLWRHNVAGDLPGRGDRLDVDRLAELVQANRARGFTYTHKPLRTPAERAAIAHANANGFTVNLSADNLSEADALADLQVAPVVVVLPTGAGNTYTPAGRRVIVCPAYRNDRSVTCATCEACANPRRSVIVGFPAHGHARRTVSIIARGSTR